jgi:hypothetical protein
MYIYTYPCANISSLLFSVKTGSRACPASYPMDTEGDLSPWVKEPGREDDQSSPSSAEPRMVELTSTPPYVFTV